jgi:signal transduction histidine kinase
MPTSAESGAGLRELDVARALERDHALRPAPRGEHYVDNRAQPSEPSTGLAHEAITGGMQPPPLNPGPCEIGLAARIHACVVPRLCAVGLVLGVDGDLPDELRSRCREELAAGLMELRAALLNTAPRQDDASSSLVHEFRRWREQGVPLQLAPGADAALPSDLQTLVCEVLAEAVRNALRHSIPSVVRVELSREAGMLILSVLSEGSVQPREGEGLGLGVGLSLAAAAAERHGGHVEWGPLKEEKWRVRLTVPIPNG